MIWPFTKFRKLEQQIDALKRSRDYNNSRIADLNKAVERLYDENNLNIKSINVISDVLILKFGEKK